jgi:hypothetical protein
MPVLKKVSNDDLNYISDICDGLIYKDFKEKNKSFDKQSIFEDIYSLCMNTDGIALADNSFLNSLIRCVSIRSVFPMYSV